MHIVLICLLNYVHTYVAAKYDTCRSDSIVSHGSTEANSSVLLLLAVCSAVSKNSLVVPNMHEHEPRIIRSQL